MGINLRILSIPSNPKHVAKLESFLTEVTEGIYLDPLKYGSMLISLTEAVNNAIKHGNCCDEDKKVTVLASYKEPSISFRVMDEGNGFNHRNVVDPTCPYNICRDGGRGVFIMKELCDSISYYNNGSTVAFSFRV